MINLTLPTTEADLMTSSRKNDFDALFRNRAPFAEFDSRRRFGKSVHRCMAVLTEDGCCADCGKEFDV